MLKTTRNKQIKNLAAKWTKGNELRPWDVKKCFKTIIIPWYCFCHED